MENKSSINVSANKGNRSSKRQLKQRKILFQAPGQQVQLDVQESIQRIIQKMDSSKIQTLQPPFFQKTLTKFREQSYSHKLRPIILPKLQSSQQQQVKSGLSLLSQFIINFDIEYTQTYCEQIRQPYIRKIFNEGYEVDKVNFKKLNQQYQLRVEIEEVINQTSEWLILLELLEDSLTRIELYFGIRSDKIMEKLKSEGADYRKGSWSDYFSSLIKKTMSAALRKGSKVVQNTGYATILSPAFAMLSLAIIGGNSVKTLKGGVDIKSWIIPIIAFTVPYMLDSMAETIERNDFKRMLQTWAEQFQQINDSIRRFNELLSNEIKDCAKSQTLQEYNIHYTNLAKYVHNLSARIDEVSSYDQGTFEEMRERTSAYFTKYVEIQQGEWITVMTQEQYKKYYQNGGKGQQFSDNNNNNIKKS